MREFHRRVRSQLSTGGAKERLFDSHAHLQDDKPSGRLDEVLARAEAAGVEKILCCGSEEGDWDEVKSICAGNPRLVPAFGLHPWYVARRGGQWLSKLKSILITTPGSAVGETGLDHAIKERNDAVQAELFRCQLGLAAELEKPATIHCRKAWEALLFILKDIGHLRAGFACHSYSGPPELIPALLEYGAYFSFSGTITRSKNAKGRASAAAVPLDRLLIETDSPDLMPVIRERTVLPDEANEPANLAYVARAVAEIRGMTIGDLAAATTKNAERLFARKGPGA